jgi:hypothetical protein
VNEGGHGAWQRRRWVRRWGVQFQSIAEHEIADVLRALGMRRESDRAYSILLEDSALKDLPTDSATRSVGPAAYARQTRGTHAVHAYSGMPIS